MQHNIKFFLKEIGGTSALSFIVLILSFLFNIYVAKILLIEEFGKYELSIAAATLFFLVINFATDLLTSKIFSKTLSIQVIFDKVLTLKIFSFLISLFLVSIFRSDFILPFLAININVFNLGWVYEIDKNNLFYSKIILLEKLIFIILCYFGITFLKKSADIIYASLFISYLISLYIQCAKKKELFNYFRFNSFNKSELLNLFFLFTISIFQYINSGISKFFIESKIDVESVALYSMGLKILIIATVFQSQIQKVYRPIFFENTSNINLGLYFKYATIPMIFIAFLSYFLFPFYINLLPSSYEGLDSFALPVCLFFLIVNLKSINTIKFTKIDKLSSDFFITSFFAVVKFAGLFFIDFDRVVSFLYYFLMLEFLEGVIKLIYTNNYEKRLLSKN